MSARAEKDARQLGVREAFYRDVLSDPEVASLIKSPKNEQQVNEDFSYRTRNSLDENEEYGFYSRNNNRYSDHRKSDSDLEAALRRNFVEEIRTILLEAFETVCETEEDRQNLLRDILDLSAGEETLPTKAPALWLEREEDCKEGPVEFIKRVYAPWLGQGLTRAHLSHLDASLYNALHKWLSGLPPEERPAQSAALAALGLPAKKQVNDQALAQYGAPSREYARLYDVARQRAARRRATDRTP